MSEQSKIDLPAIPTDPEAAPLQVSDIEFRGETIYFIFVDRFHDGDPNNSAGPDSQLYDPTHTDWGKYWGGDLQGVLDKLDYLQACGVTAVWLTPLFEQIENMSWDAAPIHGYWTKDFKRINPRFAGGPDEVHVFARNNTVFDKLVAEMHRRGMKLILDIVCNHSSPDAAGVKGQLFDDGKLVADFNDDKEHWYHHYGEVRDWNDEWQVKNCELAGLATFNENNPKYRNYIKSAIRGWLDKGVDALRVDTVKHMPLWFWQEFTGDMSSHKPATFIFGEWIYSGPNDPRSVEFANLSGMSILDFGLCTAIRQGLGHSDARGFEVIDEVFRLDDRYRNATELVTFIDNHDMPRFGTLNGDPEIQRLAVDLVLTARGIPCVYYGTEQYLHNDTNGGNDPYNRPMMEKWDVSTPIVQDMKKLSGLRRRNPAIRFGRQAVKFLSPDVYAFTRIYTDSRVLVVLNRGGATTLPELDAEMPDRTHRCLLDGAELRVAGGKTAPLQLPPKSVHVFPVEGRRLKGKLLVRVQVNAAPTKPGDWVGLIGDCAEMGDWDVERAVRLECVNPNTWFGEVLLDERAGQAVAYKYAVFRAGGGLPQRENMTGRRRVLPEKGVVKWRDVWEA
jgi:cyclomaltodextrin glucanotransferase